MHDQTDPNFIIRNKTSTYNNDNKDKHLPVLKKTKAANEPNKLV